MPADIDKLDRLAAQMDAAFRIPGTGIHIGLDSLIGLIPGIGDGLAVAPAIYIITQARNMGAPWYLIGRMATNTGIDLLIGAIPLVGDIFDVGFKANKRNVALLKEHLEKEKRRSVQTAAQKPHRLEA